MSDPLAPLARVDDEDQFFAILRHRPEVFAAYYFDLEIEPYQAELLRWSRANKRSLIRLPAQHGKSTLISKVFPIWEIACNPNVRIILVMKTSQDVSSYSDTIRKIMGDASSKLVADFGPFKPPDRNEMWSAAAFNCAKRQITDAHQTMEFFGAGGPVLGHRCDILICDDVVTDDTAGTPKRREDQLSWFRTEVQTAPAYIWPTEILPRRDYNELVRLARSDKLSPEDLSMIAHVVEVFGEDGDQRLRCLRVPPHIDWPTDISYERIIVCGTSFHPRDLYWELLGDSSYASLYYDCFWDHEKAESDVTEKSPLWPKHRPLEWLLTERESAGLLSFNKRYRNIALDPGELVFHRAHVYGGEHDGLPFEGILDRSRSFGEFEEKWFRPVGFDPASGGKTRFTTWPSFVQLGVDLDDPEPVKTRYLIDIYRAQRPLEDLIDILLMGNPGKGLPGFFDLYRWSEARVESNACQRWFLQHARIEAEIDRGLRIEPHHTGGNKWDEIMGVTSLSRQVMDRKFLIPYRYPSDQAKAQEFIDQMLMFPKGIVDFCMAWWFADLAVRDATEFLEGFYAEGHSGHFVTNPIYDEHYGEPKAAPVLDEYPPTHVPRHRRAQW